MTIGARLALFSAFALSVVELGGTPMLAPSASAADRKASQLEYLVEGGPDLGGGVHEIETRLTLNLDTGEAVLDQHQSASDEGGPIGTFRSIVGAADLEGVRKELARTDFENAPPSTQGGPGASTLGVKWSSQTGVRTVVVSSRDPAALERFDPLLSRLNDVVGAVSEHPYQAIALRVTQKPSSSGPLTFEIAVENVGARAVAIPDLQRLGRTSSDPSRAFGVRVAAFPPERPGYTSPPLRWTQLGLSGPEGTDALSVLAPGHRVVKATSAWTPASPGQRHLVQAVFASYQGPAKHDGHPTIRGRALSEAIEVVPR